MRRSVPVLALALLAAACEVHMKEDEKAAGSAPPAAAAQPANSIATAYGSGNATLPAAAIERGRRSTGWRRVVNLDTAALGPTVKSPETWDQISPEAVNGRPTFLPIGGDVEGPSALTAQILLDRALFSPGILDGRWGQNAAEAAYWFQKRNGLPATGRVDSTTLAALTTAAGSPAELVSRQRLTADDVAGPFVDIPEDIYARATLDCLCYESLREKLAELFHTSPEMLEQLNPGVDLNGLRAGQELWAPAVRDAYSRAGATRAAKLVVSDEAHYVHAVDSAGNVLYHFPSTLGSDYAPSPTGDFEVTSITHDPTWHYQPELLTGVSDTLKDAVLPAGPNNAVGVVWMALSAPHYGIHGTSAPETIGYVTSHGCVRLTNWDAEFLSHHIEPGTPVQFTDVDPERRPRADE